MSDRNDPTQTPDTGHVWDGNLRELLNEPPRWWTIGFWAGMLWVVVYFILYPAIPLVDDATKGVMGWTQIKEYKQDLSVVEEIRAPFENRIKNNSAAAILADSELSAYTEKSAKVLFGDRCAPCHGNGGAGNPGFPVLADDDWLYGGAIDAIQESIAAGREGGMPAFKSAMTAQQLDDLTTHVVALSKGGSHAPGATLFEEHSCSGCHGEDAKGVTFMGSANLTDGISRFSPGTTESIKYTIAHGVNDASDPETRNAVMPGFADRLTDAEVKKLAVYVHRLGGGQ